MTPGPFAGTTVREALDSALIALRAAKVDTPELDAEVLLAHALGIDRTRLFLDPGREVTGPAVRTFQDAVRLIEKHRVSLDRLAATLLDRETLNKDELDALLADVEPESHAAETVGTVRVVQ